MKIVVFTWGIFILLCVKSGILKLCHRKSKVAKIAAIIPVVWQIVAAVFVIEYIVSGAGATWQVESVIMFLPLAITLTDKKIEEIFLKIFAGESKEE